MVRAVKQIESLAQVNAEAGAEAEAEAELIKLLMKPFLKPITDFFMDIITHKPYMLCLGGRRGPDGLSCIYDDLKPAVTVVTKHKKMNVYNF